MFFSRYFPPPENLTAGDELSHLPIWLKGLGASEIASFKAVRIQVIRALEEIQVWEDGEQRQK